MNLFEFITRRNDPGFVRFFRVLDTAVEHKKNGSLSPCRIGISLPDLAVRKTNEVSEIPEVVIPEPEKN